MGVPGFYRWLRNKNYSGVIVPSVKKKVSSLSLDANGIFHTVREEVTKKAEAEQWSQDTFITEFAKAITDHLEVLLRQIMPQDAFVIAVDGVAPRAKLKQQRQRRFKNALLGPTYFDTNALTPGTVAMDKIDKHIQEWIKKKRVLLPRIVIYSSHLVPGEGEHKIMDIYRSSRFDDLDGIHYIHGADADLIMLSLLSPLKSIYLYREGRGREPTAMINVDLLRSRLEIPYEDFCTVLMLFGNDFIPHHPTFANMSESIDLVLRMVLEIRRERKVQTSKALFWNGEGIDFDALQELCSRLAEVEPQMITDYSKIQWKYPSRMLDIAKEGGRFSFSVFRSAWYQNALGAKNDLIPREIAQEILQILKPTSTRIVRMIHEYLRTIEWVMYYYTHGPEATSCSFLYEYYHAPLFTDLALVLGENTDCRPSEDPVLPLVQLLAVLPFTSKSLLPSAAQKLYTDPSLEDAFPISFVEEMDGINQEHLSTVILPPVPWNRLTEAVESLRLTATDRKTFLGRSETIVLERTESQEESLRRQQEISARYQKYERYRGSSSASTSIRPSMFM